MKLSAIRVRNVERFTVPTAVEKLSGGLDVLTEGNEFGKSTLFRAIEAVFLTKHSVSGAALDRMRPYGGGEPLIEADFEAGGRAFRIRKQFGRGKGAELYDLATTATLARGVEAEDELTRLIGAGDGKSNRLGLLWVGQRRSLDPADPDHGKDRGERGALQSAIEREIETVTSGAEAGLVRARLRELLVPLTGGRQKQPKTGSGFDLALRDRDRIAAELAAARLAETAASDRLTRLEHLIATRAGEHSAPALAVLADRLKAARAAHEQARSARQRLDRALAEHEKAAGIDATRARALADFDAALADLARIDAEVAPAAEQRRHAAEQLSVLEQRVAKAAAEAAGLAGEEVHNRAALTAHDAAERRRAVAERLARASRDLGAARSLEADVASSTARLAENPATAERARDIEAAACEASRWGDRLAAHRQASAPRITVALEPGGAGRVRAGEQVLATGDELLADRPVELSIAGVGVITIAPAISADTADLAVRHASADRELQAALGRAGVATVADATARRDARLADEQALDVARQTLARIAASGSAGLAQVVAALSSEHAALPEGALLADRAAADATLVELSRRRSAAETAREAVGRDIDKVRAALARLDIEHEGRERRRAEIRQKLPPDAARDGERARLRQAAEESSSFAREALRAVEALREVAPDEQRLADLASAVALLEVEVERRNRAARDLDVEISKLEGLIEQAGEEGATTRVKELEGALELAEDTVGRFETEKRGLLELDDVLATAEAEQRERFLSPVTQRLAPYLAIVFPESELRFGDGYRVTDFVREGRGEEVAALSDGTREQLAVLVRLGFGRLLAEGGRPAPLILDDALVYSDDARIGRMYEALVSASVHHQVMVLTCRVGLFTGLLQRLGGHKVSAERWLLT